MEVALHQDAELFDDGRPRSLTEFSDEAVGHERFTRIEQVENNGCDVFGQFHCELQAGKPFNSDLRRNRGSGSKPLIPFEGTQCP